ncbi:hypothetical protein QQS21_005643 [Conoideocrella luteorostrata]|uniref:L-serine ammonia-lyase n=1 Tax=Conoideocrella luteorostrata TaxID=1105319 RepID=A0AAJ0CRV2_9HYPO|nr:hypothetical protein QQS21_005643 [Conoideocrella luteorostrata]
MSCLALQALSTIRRCVLHHSARKTQPCWRDAVSLRSAQLERRRAVATSRSLYSTRNNDNDNTNGHNVASEAKPLPGMNGSADHEHAVISTFDLFSIGIGPSSSHTVGPMRAGNIFVADLVEANLLHKVNRIRISIYGSLALTGEGHMTPSALLLGLEGADVETVETAYVPDRFTEIKSTKKLALGAGLAASMGGGRSTTPKEIAFDYDRDFIWEWGRKLPLHSNGMRFTVFNDEGYVIATNDMFSVGGGFVVNGALSIASEQQSPDETLETINSKSAVQSRHPADLAENMYYKEIRRSDAAGDRRSGPEVRSFEDTKVNDPVAALPGPGNQALTSEDLSPQIAGGTAMAMTEAQSDAGCSSSSIGPEYPFRDAASLLALCHKHNLTIAQLVYQNEKSHGYTDEEIYQKLFKIWQVMDTSILESVESTEATLPGSLKMNRRAPSLYRRLTRGLYPSATKEAPTRRSLPEQWAEENNKQQSNALRPVGKTSMALNQTQNKGIRKRLPPRVHGSFDHPITPSPSRRTAFPAMDYLTVYAIAVNETNAAGGRIVTAPTNGAAGIIPAVLKYTIEFISDDPERDVPTFLLTAAAIGMLYKRGATISAAEGGCMAEVGVACSMAAGAFAACMGASPETIEQAAEIGIEHNLGLTCDPIGGLVQAPCIERNALGAIKAISSANLALSSEAGTQKVRLDDAISAMRVTAQGMRNEFKETSLSGLATSVPLNIPVSVPDC